MSEVDIWFHKVTSFMVIISALRWKGCSTLGLALCSKAGDVTREIGWKQIEKKNIKKVVTEWIIFVS